MNRAADTAAGFRTPPQRHDRQETTLNQNHWERLLEMPQKC